MTHPIDTAYVDIVPVDKSLEKLQRDIDKAMKKIDKALQKDLKKIDDDFDKTMAGLDKHMADMTEDAERHFRELDDIVENSLGDVTAEFDDAFTEIDRHFAKVGDDSERSFKKVRARFLEPLSDGLKSVGGVVSDLGRAMFQLVSGIGGAVTSNPLMALIIVLIPAVIALSAALSQLIGLVGIIPAGFGVLLAAILPVVVAFQNFGDAVSAIMSGDLEKIDEALKKLSPSAQSVAREVAALLPMLRSFQRIVQEGFFAPLVGDFTNVVRNLFPALEKGFFDVSRSMGRLVSSFAELAAAPKTFQVIRDLFATTSGIITTLTGPFRRFAEMFLNTMQAGLPFVERLAAAFGRALDTFSAFVNKSIETGEFNTFVEDAITTVKELIDLGKALGALIGTIFAGTEDSGHEFLKTLTEMAVKMNEFLKTEDGQKSLQMLVLAVQLFGASLMATAQALTFFINIFFTSLAVLEDIGRGFVGVMSTIIDWVTAAKNTVVTDFNNMVSIISSLPETIMALGPKFLSAGKNLIQSFMNGFRSVGSFIGDIAGDIVGSVKGFLNKAIDRINSGIATIDAILPGDLGRIPRLAQGAFVPKRPGGILANIGEGTEDEWVLPQSKLESMINGAGVTFSPEAINVNFTGVVPTIEEAKQTGEAIGQGILDLIGRRNARAQVRAI